jgi:hypothetical protein
MGQALTQGGSSQILQATTINPCSTPPLDLTPIHDSARPWLFVLLEHANMQHWHPTHLSASTTDSLFIRMSPRDGIFNIIGRKLRFGYELAVKWIFSCFPKPVPV